MSTSYVTLEEHVRLAQALSRIATACQKLILRIDKLEKHSDIVNNEFRTLITQIDTLGKCYTGLTGETGVLGPVPHPLAEEDYDSYVRSTANTEGGFTELLKHNRIKIVGIDPDMNY